VPAARGWQQKDGGRALKSSIDSRSSAGDSADNRDPADQQQRHGQQGRSTSLLPIVVSSILSGAHNVYISLLLL